MIFRKEANFPYPVLSNITDDYLNSSFSLDVSLQDLEDSYKFDISYSLESKFINHLLNNKQAKIYLIVESKDVKFYSYDGEPVIIQKSRISLNKRTQFQLFVVATKRISFRDNYELDPFYENNKDTIYLNPNNVLAISTVEKFDGDLKHPFELFKKTIDPKINSDIKIVFGSELIEIKYRDQQFQYFSMQNKNALNIHYVYIGLQKALMKFVFDLAEDGDEGIDLSNIDDPANKLQRKLYYLMKVKNVENINLENIDEVIYQISDRIIEKHVNAVKGLVDYES